MKQIEISRLIDQTLNAMKSLGLKESTLKSYRLSGFYRIRKFFFSHEKIYYSSKIAGDFLTFEKKRLIREKISARYYRKLQKSVALLDEFYTTGTMKWAYLHNHTTVKVNAYFSTILLEYTKTLHESLSAGTINGIQSNVLSFLGYLETNRHSDFVKISRREIRDFIVYISKSHCESMSNILYSLRSFISYLRDSGIAHIDAGLILQKPARSRKKVLPCFSHEEVESILRQIDINLSEGKRDYAILYLAAHTGLRSIDIVNLKLIDIDWKKDEIQIIQRKTGQALVLPLEPDTGRAIVEYILYGRPTSDSPYIFLRSFAPFIKLADVGSMGNIFKKYRNKAGIIHNPGDGKGLHALRRSMGTWMLEAKVPLTTISQVLGHRNQNSAKQYLSMDHCGLQECSLGLQAIETEKEELL
ncbi:MAG: tyrosine-type recombinase/integrase [Sporolactobacillus sp.]